MINRETLQRSGTWIGSTLDPYMTWLGLSWLAVWAIEPAVSAPWKEVLQLVQYVIWGIFVVEFAARAISAKPNSAFWRRHWWELVILTLPFLRFLRIVRLLRVARAGRAITSTVATARSADRTLASRVTTLVLITVGVVLSVAPLLYDAGVKPYPDALKAATLTSLHGDRIPMGKGVEPWVDVLDVALTAYSVVVFATLAGSLGAYFLQGKASRKSDSDT